MILAQGRNPFIKNRSILLIQGFNDPAADVGILRNFFNDFLIKQIDVQILGQLLGEFLRQRRRAGVDRRDHRSQRIFIFFPLFDSPLLNLVFDDFIKRDLGVHSVESPFQC